MNSACNPNIKRKKLPSMDLWKLCKMHNIRYLVNCYYCQHEHLKGKIQGETNGRTTRTSKYT